MTAVRDKPLIVRSAYRSGGRAHWLVGRWLQVMEHAALKAMRYLDELDAWENLARTRTAGLSGRTPPRLIETLRDWPLVTAPMAQELTGASRAAVQRNLVWMEKHGLVSEITGQGRFRVWRVALGIATKHSTPSTPP